jgi:hypothetical protein
VGKLEGKRPLGRRKLMQNIKMVLREIGWDWVVWNVFISLKIGTTCESSSEPSGSTERFWRRTQHLGGKTVYKKSPVLFWYH